MWAGELGPEHSATGAEVVQLLLSGLSPVGAPCSLGCRHAGCHGVCVVGEARALLVLDILLSTFALAQDISSRLCLCLPCLPLRCPQTVFSPPSSLGSNIITSERTSLAALFQTEVSALDSLRPFLLLPSTDHLATHCRHCLEYSPNPERGLPSGVVISVWPECGLACSGASRKTR